MIKFQNYLEYFNNSPVGGPDAFPNFPLYHYTNSAGMRGIVEGDLLWLTHFRFLNDYSERAWGYQVLFERIRERFKDVDDADFRNGIEKLIEIISQNYDLLAAHVFCLSAERNSLNQWRYYGGDIAYSLAFDTTKFASDNYFVQAYKIIYKYEDQIAFVDRIIDVVNQYYQDHRAELEKDDEVEDFMRMISSTVSYSIMRLKNPAFEAEQEWRLVYMNIDEHNQERLKFRNGRWGMVPYIEMKPPLASINLPITEIMVGPSPHAETAQHSLSMFLDVLSRKDIKLSRSTIPIR
jgi:hypothetical protein